MTIASFLVLIAVIGLVTWLLATYVAKVEPIRTILVVVACLIVILLVLQAFGLLGGLNQPVPRIH